MHGFACVGGEVLKIKINKEFKKYLFLFLINIPRRRRGGIQ
jgi:hypothetical protein